MTPRYQVCDCFVYGGISLGMTLIYGYVKRAPQNPILDSAAEVWPLEAFQENFATVHGSSGTSAGTLWGASYLPEAE